MFKVERFHSRGERGVKQELFAHFTLLLMTRLFTNHSEGGFCSEVGKPPMHANFHNAVRTVGRTVATLLLQYATTLGQTVDSILASIAGCRRRQRPNRSNPAGVAQARKQMEVPQARQDPNRCLTPRNPA